MIRESSQNVIWVIRSRKNRRWEKRVTGIREKRSICRSLVVKLEGKRPPGRPRHRWIDNIGMDLKYGWENIDLIIVAQDRDEWSSVMNTTMKSWAA